MDGGVLLCENEHKLNQFVKKLKKEFETTIKRNLKSFLSMNIDRSQGDLKLTQKNFSKRILSRSEIDESKPVDTPLVKCDEELKRNNCLLLYRSDWRSFVLYLSTKTRPDLVQAVGHENSM